MPSCYGVLRETNFIDVTFYPCFACDCGGGATADRRHWIYHSSCLLNCCNFCWIRWSQPLCIHCEPEDALADDRGCVRSKLLGSEIRRFKYLVSGCNSCTVRSKRSGFFCSFCFLCFLIAEIEVRVSGWKSGAVPVQAVTSSIVTVPFGPESRIRVNIVLLHFQPAFLSGGFSFLCDKE